MIKVLATNLPTLAPERAKESPYSTHPRKYLIRANALDAFHSIIIEKIFFFKRKTCIYIKISKIFCFVETLIAAFARLSAPPPPPLSLFTHTKKQVIIPSSKNKDRPGISIFHHPSPSTLRAMVIPELEGVTATYLSNIQKIPTCVGGGGQCV